MSFAGKVALVTGSTSGIGLGIARTLAAEGCSIILNGFGDDKLIQDLNTEFTDKHKVRCAYVSADLAHVPEIRAMCKKVNELFPEGIDILVNNAGFNHVCKVVDFPEETWDLMMAVMLSAPFHLIKHFLPAMQKKGWGRIINISSIHGLISTPGKVPYTAAKHGIVGLTKGVAIEAAQTGVTCNAVCPGFVSTDLIQKQLKDVAAKHNITEEEAGRKFFLEKYVPSMKFVTVDQVNGLVKYLCSDGASMMTGAAINMDGGWLAT